MSIFLVVGTRPQIIKTAPLVLEALRQGLELKIIHTGQHYDRELSQVFFEELSSPEPLFNLNVGSGTHVFQTAEIMQRLEKHLTEEKPSLVLTPGDTNSALASALTSAKMQIPVGHIESGARCYDMKMAEEINRRLIDHCSSFLFAPTRNCQNNLKKESVFGKIYLTGDTMYDAFLDFQSKTQSSTILERLQLKDKEYALLTTHRAENVDDPAKLNGIIKAIQTAKMETIFPVHPRTQKRLDENSICLSSTNIQTIDPVGYIDMLALLKHSKMTITDSGGLQKEAFWSKTPCITIREKTEWTETTEMGVNFITGVDPLKIRLAIENIQENYAEIKNRFTINPFGDGKASNKIVRIIKQNIK